MKHIFFVLFVLVQFSFANKVVIKNFSFGNKKIKFISFPEKRITISASCVLKNKIKNCDASKAITMASKKKIAAVMVKDYRSRNPGALLCMHQFKSKVLIGWDKHKNETSFCKFQDNSIIGTGTLMYYAFNVNK